MRMVVIVLRLNKMEITKNFRNHKVDWYKDLRKYGEILYEIYLELDYFFTYIIKFFRVSCCQYSTWTKIIDVYESVPHSNLVGDVDNKTVIFL